MEQGDVNFWGNLAGVVAGDPLLRLEFRRSMSALQRG